MGDHELQIFSERLKELRTDLNLTQVQFIEGLGITASALSAYEKNSKNPSISVAKRIAEKYDVSVDWLCGLSDKKTRDNSVETYADVIKILLKLLENKNLNTKIFTFPFEKAAFFGFENNILHKFFIDWEKIKNIYDQKVIDVDMYQPWIDSKLKELNTPIKKSQSDKISYLISSISYDYEEAQKNTSE